MASKRTIFERVLALALALVLTIGLAPVVTLNATAVDPGSMVADESTMNTWKNYFGRNDTAYAGAIWTDKSVFTGASAFSDVTKLPDGSAASVTVEQDNFLVALSAIASTSQITGRSSNPTDTMLVLDVSGSMVSDYTVGYRRQQGGGWPGGNNNNYTYRSVTGVDTSNVEAMVEAANAAIDTLLKQNNYNRVGVVLYSGGSGGSATVLLPLGRYTGVSGEYISADLETNTQELYSRSGSDRNPTYTSMGRVTYATDVSISLRNGITQDGGGTVRDTSRDVVGATFIQGGLYTAWQQFSGRIQANDTAVSSANSQASTKRIPVMVLMSDGAPTKGTTDYSAATSETFGSGSSSTTELSFVSQLTASWVKASMSAGYGTDAKFYTLGLGDAGTNSYAVGVMNPASASNVATSDWNTVLAGRRVEVDDEYISLPTNLDMEKNYADQYWYAADAAGMIDAFNQIVSQIVLQSKYYATLVSGGAHDIDGYITITDEIGEHMEVKKVTGIVIGNELYSGAEMAHALSTGVLGTPGNSTDLGDEFVWTVMERLGIEEASVAQSLISSAYAAKQLWPGDASAPVSNYIGWYESADGKYLGHWNDSHTAADYPADAKYINKSYGYLGDHQDSDMMHVIVKVSTDIQSGHQMVSYQIPASLIPMVTYTITMEGATLDTATNVTMTHDAATQNPMRLLYEVGLVEGINEVTVEKLMEEADHSHKNDDGSYSFYSNRWGITDLQDPTNPTSHKVATAHFHPSLENEYYYFKEAETVLDASGNAVTSLDTTGATQYYYNRQVVTITSGTAASVTNVLMPLSAKDLVHAEASGSNYVIPAGTANMPANDVRMTKTDLDPATPGIQHPTDTLDYYSYPYGVHEHTNGDFDMYTYLGNNGTFTITPATGIKLTKTVTEAVEGAATSFTFTVTLDQAAPNASVTDTDGNALTGWSISADNKVITLTLAADETVCIIGLPEGAAYTVEEAVNAHYAATITPATGTVTANSLIAVNATNAPKAYGSLIIEKEVIHPFGGNLDNVFGFTAVIEGLTQEEAQAVTCPGGVTFEFNDGTLTISKIVVKDDDSVTIGNIPAGAKYTVTEKAADGFTQDTAKSSKTTGEIPANSSVTAQFVNTYTPTAVTPTITVSGTKTLKTNVMLSDEFIFRVEKYNEATGEYAPVENAADIVILLGYSTHDATGNYEIALSERYTTVGTHYYRIVEVAGSNENMVYDASQGLFAVTVTDEGRDGQLEVSVTGRANVTVSGTTVDKDFLNTFTADATHVDIEIDKSVEYNGLEGYKIPLNSFTFTLTNNADASDTHTVTTNADGYAAIRLPITQAGTLTYTLKEVAGNLNAMTYDTDERTVTIVTTAHAETGKLVSTVKIGGEETNTAKFVNEYEVAAVDVSLPATKTLTNLLTNSAKAFAAGDFKLEYIAADDTYKALDGESWKQVDFAADGSATVTLLDDCKSVGTFRFILREVDTDVPGVTYDSAVYHITVTTSVDDANKKLIANTVINKVGEAGAQDAVSFANTYTVTGEAKLPLSGAKELLHKQTSTPKAFNAGDFSFTLYSDDQQTTLQTVHNHADGTYAFEDLVFTAADLGKTFKYTVAEVKGDLGGVEYDDNSYTFSITVADDGKGGIELKQGDNTVTKLDDLDFTNLYTTKIAEVTFGGEKKLVGRDLQTGDGFTFELVDAATGEVLQTKTLVGNKFTFDTISYDYNTKHDVLGKHYYVIREKIPAENDRLGGVTYDASTYEIEVSVTDLNGVMSAKVTVTKPGVGEVSQDNILFTNHYAPAPTDLELTGTKEVSGREMTANDVFTFSVYEGDELVSTGSNNGETITFEAITYTKAGIHTYTVVEDIPEGAEQTDAGYIKDKLLYDGTAITVTVEVTDNSKGTLTAKVTSQTQVLFTNTYIPDNIDVEFDVKKTVENKTAAGAIGPNGFQFTLSENGQVIDTQLSDSNGDAKFSLSYGAADVGEHTYVIRETDTKKTGVTYDDTYYTVTVNVVRDTVTGDLSATCKVAVDDGAAQDVNAVEVGFHNTYEKSTTPQTGDPSTLLPIGIMMLLSAAVLAALLLLKKKHI